MANYPKDLKYTKEDEWARIAGKTAVVGITWYAQDKLGDVAFVDVRAKVGDTVTAGQSFGAVESTKAVADLFSPVTGKVVKVNGALADAPNTVNEDPYGRGWLMEVELSDSKQLDELMDASAYEKHLSSKGH